ncbi:MAG: prephenate dehydrogenase/arogenate dehydrogenase family protein [Turneriella sp.]
MKIFIWGMGLIGTSLALALREKGHQISGSVRSAKSRETLARMGFERVTTDEAQALQMLQDCDMLALGLNVNDCFRILDIALSDSARATPLIVFDMCSTKTDICAHAGSLPLATHFVGTHPMAGKEKQGPEAADATLFAGQTVFVTATEAAANAASTVTNIWQSVGAQIVPIDARVHDRTMAYVSHGLHLAACMIADLSGEVFDPAMPVSPVAGSYRDMTRIAMSSGEMWQSITDTNRENIADWLTELGKRSATLAQHVRSGQADIKRLFADAERARRKFMRT